MTIPSEEDLLKAACHIGHKSRKWNPKMKPFIYGVRKGVHIFDLSKTRTQLEKVCQALQELQSAGKTILFVSTKQHSTHLLEEIKQKTSHPIVTKKWMPGLLTNWKTIGRRIKYYQELQESFRTGEIDKYTKKEINSLRKQLAKLDAALGGVSDMNGMPNAVFVVDAVRDIIAVKEAHSMHIPVFGICDSIGDPDHFSIPIPANDDAIRSVSLLLTTVLQSLEEAPTSQKEEEIREEKIPPPPTSLDATATGI